MTSVKVVGWWIIHICRQVKRGIWMPRCAWAKAMTEVHGISYKG